VYYGFGLPMLLLYGVHVSVVEYIVRYIVI